MHGLVVTGVLFLLGALAAWRIGTGAVGPDPAKWLLHQSGFWALAFLAATLAVSPLRRISGRAQWLRWRRPLGLAMFALASLHLLVYLTVYQGLAWQPVLDDVTRRPYILIGVLAWLLLVPLAVTSTRQARRRLGARWTALHRAVYVVAPLGVLHQAMAQKADLGETLVFSAIFACFLIERAVAASGLVRGSREP